MEKGGSYYLHVLFFSSTSILKYDIPAGTPHNGI